MNIRVRIILFGIVACIILGVVYFLFTLVVPRHAPSPVQAPSPTFPIVTITPFLTPTGVLHPTEVGSQSRITIVGVSIVNVLDNPISRDSSGIVLFKADPDFNFTFDETTQEFGISLLGSPYEETKLKAEVEFIKTLGVNKHDACFLTVNITTPQFANPDEAGKRFPLSFCEHDID